MSNSSIFERLLGNNKILTEKYISDNILLTRSILVRCDTEARLYNEFLETTGRFVNQEDKTTWRYFHHLAGMYHAADRPILIMSKDTGEEEVLTKELLYLHRSTRKELFKYGYYYNELISKYPDQELLIKAIMAYDTLRPISELITLPTFSIVGYSKELIEVTETDLINRLQERIDNYKSTRLLTMYSRSDSLYMASLFSILYHFLLTSLLNIRLSNAKTPFAHSYHIRNFLASNHGLDEYITAIDRDRTLWLYRNLLYLNNKSGQQANLELLTDELMTPRHASVTAYQYEQLGKLDESDYMKYGFTKTLINKTELMYDRRVMTLENIKAIESRILRSNEVIFTANQKEIDQTFKYVLNNKAFTKDMEVSLIDNSNEVRSTFYDVFINHWAKSVKSDRASFFIKITDSVAGMELDLRSSDAFKLFTILLHYANGIKIDTIPDYYGNNTIKENPPSLEELLSVTHYPSREVVKLIKDLRDFVPAYPNNPTSFVFINYIQDVYNWYLGSWLQNTSISEKYDNLWYDSAVKNITGEFVLSFDDENVLEFLSRFNITHVLEYSRQSLLNMIDDLLTNISGVLNADGGASQELRHRALVEILRKFKSFTTQLIDTYSSGDLSLGMLKTPLYAVADSTINSDYWSPSSHVNIEIKSGIKSKNKIDPSFDIAADSDSLSTIICDTSSDLLFEGVLYNHTFVHLSNPFPVIEGNETPATQEHLLFLATN